jgi:hypothetical protein
MIKRSLVAAAVIAASLLWGFDGAASAAMPTANATDGAAVVSGGTVFCFIDVEHDRGGMHS